MSKTKCPCGHARDEHSVYGCVDECGCERRPDLRRPDLSATEATEEDTCHPLEVDGEMIRVRVNGELTEETQAAIADVIRAAKRRFSAEHPEPAESVLETRLRLAHKARRAKEHQLDGVRRALCDAGYMEDDDPYGHADLEGVIRQVGEVDRKQLASLRAEVTAARQFAGEMRDFCSPHAVAADYADRLLEAMDRAKEKN
jgi:hypothetical protein